MRVAIHAPLVLSLVLASAPIARAQGIAPTGLFKPGLAPLLFGGMAAQEEKAPLPRARAPMTAEAAKTWLRLQQKVPMNFAEETPLEDLLKYIAEATRTKDEGDNGLAIYVDPIGLQEAEKTETTPVKIHIEGVPLANSLEIALGQLDLAYYVRPDGLLFVQYRGSGEKGEHLMNSVAPVSAKAARVWVELFKPVSMPFPNETPLEDVLKYIEQATINPDLPDGIPVYVDPAALQAAEKSESSPVKLNLEGIPLAHTLGLLLAQLDLGYFVDEFGLLHVTDRATAKAATARAPTAEEMGEMEQLIDLLKAQVEGLKKAKGGGMMGGPPAQAPKPKGGGLQ